MIKVLISFTILLLLCNTCDAQWKFAGAGSMEGTGGGGDYALGVHDSMLFRSDGNGLWLYTPNGSHAWVQENSGIDFNREVVTTFASLGHYMYAGMIRTDNGANGAIYRSNDTDFKWSYLQAAGPISTNGTYLFASSFASIYRSRDSGNTWQEMPCKLAQHFGTLGACILASTSWGLFRSTDSGSNWIQTSPPPTLSLSAFASIGSRVFAGGMAVFQSTDSGQSWSSIGLSNKNIHALAATQGYLFAGTDSGVFVSSDSGLHWRAVSEGLTAWQNNPLDAQCLAVLDTELFVDIHLGDGRGYVAKRPISEMADTPKRAVQLAPITVRNSLTAYPNPFCGTTTISYHLRESGPVQITIVDILGHTTNNIVNKWEKAGPHEAQFDASPLPSGIYWCHFSANGEEHMRKLLLTR